MARLVMHFGWTWVGTIAANDDYGKYGIKAFKKKVEDAGVCISFSETLSKVRFLCFFFRIGLSLSFSPSLPPISLCLMFVFLCIKWGGFYP